MSRKLFITIAIVFIALVSGIFAYKTWQGRQLAQQSFQNSISVQDKTTNWKVYRNEEYGFEVKYPQTWELIPPENYWIKNPHEFGKDYQAWGIIGFRDNSQRRLGGDISIIRINSNLNSLTELIGRRYAYVYNPKTETNDVELGVPQKLGTKYYNSFLFNDRTSAYRIWSTGEGTVNEGIFFEISPDKTLGIEAISELDDTIELDEEMNDILSTFKLLK